MPISSGFHSIYILFFWGGGRYMQHSGTENDCWYLLVCLAED